jgi:hypothetical protein
MDSHRFDHLTRELAQSLGRRRVAGLFFGSGLSALIVGTTLDAKARKRKKRKKKKSPPATPPLAPPPASPSASPPPTGCTPTCAGKGCGADDGCGQPCQTGNCPTNQTCRNGLCITADGCNPPCAAGRQCYQGTCTCTNSAQCANERNPNGFNCVGAPGNPSVTICGCTHFAGLNNRVCVAGEPCSVCCSDLECQAQLPGVPDVICATVSSTALTGRSCCRPPGSSPCGGCCSGFCNGAVCGCIAGGQPCGQHEQCCSLQCGTQADPGKCAPPERRK